MSGIDVEQALSNRRETSATLAFLESRVREEANAAARAGCVEAALAHVSLATHYAARLAECSGQSGALDGRSWVAAHRIW